MMPARPVPVAALASGAARADWLWTPRASAAAFAGFTWTLDRKDG